jgi:tartrate dehydrogenase/decarboxylase/D-malate dehydrogenase
LRHLGEERIAHAITRAVHATLAEPENRTRDLGGTATLDAVTDAIVDHLS